MGFFCICLSVVCCVAVRSLLSITNFSLVLEEDGSFVPDDVVTSVIAENDKLGTLMILQPSQSWTAG